jgi:hypothetical protein
MMGKDVKGGIGGVGRFFVRLWNGPQPRAVQAE